MEIRRSGISVRPSRYCNLPIRRLKTPEASRLFPFKKRGGGLQSAVSTTAVWRPPPLLRYFISTAALKKRHPAASRSGSSVTSVHSSAGSSVFLPKTCGFVKAFKSDPETRLRQWSMQPKKQKVRQFRRRFCRFGRTWNGRQSCKTSIALANCGNGAACTKSRRPKA